MNAVGAFVTATAIYLGAALVGAWLTMLVMGMAHTMPGLEWVPPLGYTSTIVLTVLVRMLCSPISTNWDKK